MNWSKLSKSPPSKCAYFISTPRKNGGVLEGCREIFESGFKFVILDEVDYMTKNAQHALRYLIQQYSSNVRFCLICNYISRIDSALQKYSH